MRKRGFLHLVFLYLATATAFAQTGEVSLVAPADNATEVAVAPNFTWLAADGATTYQIQVARRSNMKQMEFDVDGITGTSFSPENPLSGTQTYYWRVRGIGVDTGPWSTIRSFSTGQLPDAPSLSSPANDAKDVPLSPELTWNEANGATSYEVELSLESNFSSLVFSQGGIAGTSLTVALVLDPQTKYYWRVRPANDIGDGPYSSANSFTTIVSIPGQVLLSAPADGETDVDTKPTFSWEAVAGADTYTLEVSGTSGFGTLLLQESGIKATTFAPSTDFLNGAVLYWRVRATNAAGDGPDSSIRQFTTTQGGSMQVQLVAPADSSTDIVVTPMLTWSAVDGASSYRVELGKQSDFASEILYNTVVGATEFQTGVLEFEQTYYWRVRASNAGSENWSIVRSFTTEAGTPTEVVLSFPPDNAADQPLSFSLTWNAADRAETYNVEVGLNSDFSVLLVSETDLTSTAYVLEALDPSTEYFWRVQGQNELGTGPWSSGRQFTTRMLLAPAAPVLIYPPDAAAGVSLHPVLSWNESERAETYKLELSTEPPDELENFTTVITAVVITQPFFQAPELSPSTEHYWRVEARNAEGSTRSAVWRFRTSVATASESDEIPADYSLHANYPNPFNPSTSIGYDVPEPANVRITVYDPLGRIVETLVDGQQSAGRHTVTWNADGAPSGVYIVRMEAGTYAASRSMLLLR